MQVPVGTQKPKRLLSSAFSHRCFYWSVPSTWLRHKDITRAMQTCMQLSGSWLVPSGISSNKSRFCIWHDKCLLKWDQSKSKLGIGNWNCSDLCWQSLGPSLALPWPSLRPSNVIKHHQIVSIFIKSDFHFKCQHHFIKPPVLETVASWWLLLVSNRHTRPAHPSAVSIVGMELFRKGSWWQRSSGVMDAFAPGCAVITTKHT